MRKQLSAALGTILALAGSAASFGWNATGHEVVALVAWDNMSPAARERATQLLKEHPQYNLFLINKSVSDPAEAAKTTFALAATWPDIVRSTTLSPKNHLYHHPYWHYSDTPYVSDDYPPGAAEPKMPSDKWEPGDEPQNLFQAYHKVKAELADPKVKEEDKAIDLAWIEHVVGDIHQPLHAVSWYSKEYPHGDQGGNLVIININGHIDGLHWTWDGMLGGYEPMNYRVMEEIAGKAEKENPASGFTDQIKDLTVTDWAAESFKASKEIVYAGGHLPHITKAQLQEDRLTPVPELPKEYMEKAVPLAKQRAALAGYRLAAVLNDLFAAGPVPQSQPASAPASEPALTH